MLACGKPAFILSDATALPGRGVHSYKQSTYERVHVVK